MEKSYITPPPLQAGDTVGIIATAGKVKAGSLEKGITILQNWGLQVVTGQHLMAAHGYFAGSDAQRLYDLQELIQNPKIKAIFCARGGYGTTRIIDQVDFQPLQLQPKWFIGFSDITALHYQLHKLGFQSIHGQTISAFDDDSATDSIRKVLFNEKTQISGCLHEKNQLGNAEGLLIGGNLSIICHLLGTNSDVDTTGKILFIEEVGEALYHFDRMMIQLLRAGKLDKLAGLIIGQMSGMTNPDNKFALSISEIILEKTQQFNYPIAFDFPIGHISNNWAIPCGKYAKLEVSAKQCTLKFSN